MKTITRFLTIFAILLTTSCCSDENEPESRITFNFSLQCSEELLDFVSPSATFIDAEGKECSVEIPKSEFVKIDNTGLVQNEGGTMYNWKKQIILLGVTTAQRDMRVTYNLRDNAPLIDIDKTYTMIHELECGYEKKTGSRTYTDNSSIAINLTINGSSTNEISGSNLKAYLDNLVQDSDYVKREVE